MIEAGDKAAEYGKPERATPGTVHMPEKQISAAAERRALVAQYYVSGGDPGQRMQFAVDFAQSGLKALFLANGGALLALLTFFHPEKSGVPTNVGLLAIGMVGYAVGLACALVASIGAHISQNLT